MNYFIVAAVLVAFTSSVVRAGGRDDTLDCLDTYMVMHVSLQPKFVPEWVNYTRECKAQNNVGPELCWGLLEREYPQSKDEACFFSCFAQKINVVLANSVNLEAIRTSMSDIQFKKANKCLEKYSPPTDNELERCWNVYKTHQCYMAAIDKPEN